jgi:ribosome modulation factor
MSASEKAEQHGFRVGFSGALLDNNAYADTNLQSSFKDGWHQGRAAMIRSFGDGSTVLVWRSDGPRRYLAVVGSRELVNSDETYERKDTTK